MLFDVLIMKLMYCHVSVHCWEGITYIQYTHTHSHSMDSEVFQNDSTYTHTHTAIHTTILFQIGVEKQIIDNFEDFILLLFSLRICPAFENILSRGTEVATTQNPFFSTV